MKTCGSELEASFCLSFFREFLPFHLYCGNRRKLIMIVFKRDTPGGALIAHIFPHFIPHDCQRLVNRRINTLCGKEKQGKATTTYHRRQTSYPEAGELSTVSKIKTN